MAIKDVEKKKKYFHSKTKFINIPKINFINKNNKKNENETKNINFINKKNEQYKQIFKHKINTNNTSILVNTPSKHDKTVNKNPKLNQGVKKLEKNEIMPQNKDISCMKEFAPKIPELMNHEFNLRNKNILDNKSNETFGELNKGTIPIIFYNHVMITENSTKIGNKKNKYLKSSITQKNKKKLLTIIYYSPKQ